MATTTHPAQQPVELPVSGPPSGARKGTRAPRNFGGVPPLRAGQGHSFLLRRLHSLSGIVPIGAFLIEHLVSNFEALKGPAAYAAQVKFLNALPFVRVLEWVFIFLPLIYHAGYGMYIWLRGKSNVVYYPWAGNWLYTAQRWTGGIALAYILQHVWRQRFSGVNLPDHPGAAFHKVQMELLHPWMFAIYAIAMIATCYHFAYGVWLFSAKWGITPGDRARRNFGWVCAVAGLLLCTIGLASMYAFVEPKYRNAPPDLTPAQITEGTQATAPIGQAHTRD